MTVNDGEVRVFYGNGDGTFDENPYFVSGVLHNAGTLLADVGHRRRQRSPPVTSTATPTPTSSRAPSTARTRSSSCSRNDGGGVVHRRRR